MKDDRNSRSRTIFVGSYLHWVQGPNSGRQRRLWDSDFCLFVLQHAKACCGPQTLWKQLSDLQAKCFSLLMCEKRNVGKKRGVQKLTAWATLAYRAWREPYRSCTWTVLCRPGIGRVQFLAAQLHSNYWKKELHHLLPRPSWLGKRQSVISGLKRGKCCMTLKNKLNLLYFQTFYQDLNSFLLLLRLTFGKYYFCDRQLPKYTPNVVHFLWSLPR